MGETQTRGVGEARVWKRTEFYGGDGARLALAAPPQPPNAAERPVDYRSEQQHDRQRRDRADETVGPEPLHVAAGADHRQAERILGAVAGHERQRERRQRNSDFLEDITDDAEA